MKAILHTGWLCLLLLLVGCGPRESAHHEQLFTFGTLVEISIWGEQEDKAHRAVEALAADFETMHRAWHAWQPGPLVSLNEQLASGREVEVPPEIMPLLRRAQVLSSASGGLFDPAIGHLVQLWGFHADLPPQGPPPQATLINDFLVRRPTLASLVLGEHTARSDNPALWLDFGAFAKGYGVDRAIEHLQTLGIENAIVNAGGDLRVIGRHGERPWRIGIRDPRGRDILASIDAASGESIFTSGDYERYYEHEGRRYHHIIDPRSGYPAMQTTSVTVIHDDAATADAAATALFVAGPRDWQATARALGLQLVMLVDPAGTVHMTPAMAERVHFELDPPPPVDLSEAL